MKKASNKWCSTPGAKDSSAEQIQAPTELSKEKIEALLTQQNDQINNS